MKRQEKKMTKRQKISGEEARQRYDWEMSTQRNETMKRQDNEETNILRDETE